MRCRKSRASSELANERLPPVKRSRTISARSNTTCAVAAVSGREYVLRLHAGACSVALLMFMFGKPLLNNALCCEHTQLHKCSGCRVYWVLCK